MFTSRFSTFVFSLPIFFLSLVMVKHKHFLPFCNICIFQIHPYINRIYIRHNNFLWFSSCGIFGGVWRLDFFLPYRIHARGAVKRRKEKRGKEVLLYFFQCPSVYTFNNSKLLCTRTSTWWSILCLQIEDIRYKDTLMIIRWKLEIIIILQRKWLNCRGSL